MRKLPLVLIVAMFALSACGGGDDASSDTSVGATSETGDTKTDSKTDTSADTDFSGKGSGDFCELAKQYEKDFKDTGDPSQSTDDAKKEYKELAAAIVNLEKQAPSEIKADVATVGKAFDQLDKLLSKYDYDFTKVPESEAGSVDVDSPTVQAASNRVESYFEKVCKIDVDEDGDTDGVVDDSSGDEQAPAGTTGTTEAG